MDEITTRKRPRRTPGAGSLYETSAGLWRGAFIVTDPLTHRRVRKFVSGHSLAEARKRLREAMDAASREKAAVESPTVA